MEDTSMTAFETYTKRKLLEDLTYVRRYKGDAESSLKRNTEKETQLLALIEDLRSQGVEISNEELNKTFDWNSRWHF